MRGWALASLALMALCGPPACRARGPAAALTTSPAADLPDPMPRPDGFRRGASLGLFVSDPEPAVQQRIYSMLLDEMAATGVTDVELVVRYGQQTVDSPGLARRAGLTPDDALLATVIGAARARGMRVFLLPIVHVEERAMGVWRGTLAPPDLERWWADYRAFVLHYARLAEASGAVGLFSVGSELLSLEGEVPRWRALIADVRAVYHGQLTYSANWDHYAQVPFWDALDVVGLTAYHELTPIADPDEAALVAGWRSWAEALIAWADARDLRFVSTEIGYPSSAHGAARPWDHREGEHPALDLQLRCYRALYRAWHAEPRLAGLYVWNWFGFGGADDRGYTPRGKPARAVLARWFEDSRVGIGVLGEASR